MARIAVLDSQIFNRIAAGEVVLGPASVVKELVENSIDALATEITISITEGGTKRIIVTDNGAGIYPDELKTAFLPHSTSKISKLKDLDEISTLGFRGEALPSIASVSKVTVKSKPCDVENASVLTIDGGEFGEVKPMAFNDGTEITVDNLFYNTPARKKFMKQPSSEKAEVTSVVTKLILCNPNIKFNYITDGEVIFESEGTGLFDAIRCVYGYHFTDNLLEVSYVREGIRINGYIGKPIFTKKNRNYQVLLINDRFVKDYSISATVQNAYGNYLMKGNFPVFILNIVLPFDEVDVNVHPSKAEVKFLNITKVLGCLYHAVNEKLYENQQIPLVETQTPDTKAKSQPPEKVEAIQDGKNLASLLSAVGAKMNSSPVSTAKTTLSESSESFSSLLKDLISKDKKYSEDEISVSENKTYGQQNPNGFLSPLDRVLMKNIVGQLFNTYILIELEHNLYIIDQHAAHERLLYDDMVFDINHSSLVMQDLLVPYTRSFSVEDYEIISQVLDDLQILGFDIYEYGKRSIKITTIPFNLRGINIDDFIDSFLNDKTFKESLKASDLVNDNLIQAACKAAIKGGDKLNEKQINNLVLKMLDNNTPLRCPHGRPAVICITETEMEKWFKRIV